MKFIPEGICTKEYASIEEFFSDGGSARVLDRDAFLLFLKREKETGNFSSGMFGVEIHDYKEFTQLVHSCIYRYEFYLHGEKVMLYKLNESILCIEKKYESNINQTAVGELNRSRH